MIEKLYKEDAFNKLSDKNKYYVINDENNNLDNNITFLSIIKNNKYILMKNKHTFNSSYFMCKMNFKK